MNKKITTKNDLQFTGYFEYFDLPKEKNTFVKNKK